MTRIRAWWWFSAASGRTPSHSAYRFSFVTVEYRWHPFHGRRLPARDAGRRDGIVLFVDGDPHVSRKVPDWMCDAAVCRAMTEGQPLARVDELSVLSETLADLLPGSAAPPSSASPGKEAADEDTDVTTANPPPAEPAAAVTGGGAGAGSRRSSARIPGPADGNRRSQGGHR